MTAREAGTAEYPTPVIRGIQHGMCRVVSFQLGNKIKFRGIFEDHHHVVNLAIRFAIHRTIYGQMIGLTQKPEMRIRSPRTAVLGLGQYSHATKLLSRDAASSSGRSLACKGRFTASHFVHLPKVVNQPP
jgi:hypothetical protein